MANLPVRSLGEVGIITDVNAHDLVPNAFSNGSNVLFRDNTVVRAPVFKDLFDQTAQVAQEDGPVTAFNYNDPDSGAIYGVAYDDNTVVEYDNGVSSSVTPSGAVTSGSSSTPWTHTEIAGLSILCRKSAEPYIRDSVVSNTYQLMSTNDWPAADRASAMRGFKDFIIALNVTAGGTDYDTMVKWTDGIAYKANVTSVEWTASASNLAGSNILTDFKTPIVDGLALGNMFLIYSTTESAIMEYTGSSNVFSFRNFYQGDGVINQNCVASTGKEHFVFGDTDIYMHNGVTVQSLAQSRVKNKIYADMVRDQQSRFFVHLDQVNDLVYFCYVSAESNVPFTSSEYCNRAAVYDIKSKTWTFVDLPNTFGAAYTNVSLSSSTYANISGSYAANANKYAQYEDTSPRISAFASARDDNNSLTEGRVYANDMLLTGLLSAPSNSETLKTAFVERVGIDVDETKAPLRSYKQINSIIPQITTVGGTDQVRVKVGATDFPHDTSPNYVTNYLFTPSTDHKVDSRAAGRLVAYRVEEENGNFFNFSAADFEITVNSGR